MSDLKELMSRIRQVYEGLPQRPLLMATLGSALRSEGIDLPPNCKLSNILSRMDDLTVIADADRPLIKYVVERPESEAKPSLRRSLARAFTLSIPEGKKIYFKITAPFEYRIDDTAPSKSFVEIEEHYRLPHLENRYEKNPEADEQLRETIKKWAEHSNVDNKALYFTHAVPQTDATANNMLYRLLEAQSPEVRKNMRIPGDIAHTLASMK